MQNAEWETYFFFTFVFVFLIIVTKIAVSSFDSCSKPDSLFWGRIFPSTVNYQLTKQADDWHKPVRCFLKLLETIAHFGNKLCLWPALGSFPVVCSNGGPWTKDLCAQNFCFRWFRQRCIHFYDTQSKKYCRNTQLTTIDRCALSGLFYSAFYIFHFTFPDESHGHISDPTPTWGRKLSA